MQLVIELGRVIRDRKSKPLKQPLRKLTIVHPNTAVLHSLKGELSEYIYQETNVRELATCSDPQKFGTLRAEPVFAVCVSAAFSDIEKAPASVRDSRAIFPQINTGK